jgi:protein-S-isoprenylcysteine O-methyltransferase Ste14
MQRFMKTVALMILGISLGSLDLVVWFLMRLPFGIESANLEVNHALVSWHLLVRCVITAILVWTFLYFRAHCVTANREESTKVVTKG